MIDAYASEPNPSPSARPPRVPGSGSKFSFNLAESMSEAGKLDAALAEFKKEAQKTPRERCRDQVMKEWHVTQEKIDSLPLKEAPAINDRIEQEVSRRMQTAEPSDTAQVGIYDPMEASAQAATPAVPAAQVTTLRILGMHGASASALAAGTGG